MEDNYMNYVRQFIFRKLFLFITFLVVSFHVKAQIPAGYNLVEAAEGVALYRNSRNDYVQIIDLAKGASIKTLLGEKNGMVTMNNVDCQKFDRKQVQDFWPDFEAENGSTAFSIVNGSFYDLTAQPYGTTATPIAFPIKDRGTIETIGFGNGEPLKKKMLVLKNSRAQIANYDGQYPETIETNPAPNIIVGLKMGQKEPLLPVGRTNVAVGGALDSNGYSTIYILTTQSMTSAMVENTLLGFGGIQMMAFDGGYSANVCPGGLTTFFLTRPVPHAIGILAAPVHKTYTIANAGDLPICGTTQYCNNSMITYDGNVIGATATVSGNQITFDVSKCNQTAFSADGKYSIREESCAGYETNLIAGNYTKGQMSFSVTTALPNNFQTTCKTYYVMISPGGHYRTGGIKVCLESIGNALHAQSNVWSASQHADTTNVTALPDPEMEIQVVPNPNRGAFTVELGQVQEKEIRVRLLNIIGAEVFSQNLKTKEGKATILFQETKELPAGTYLLNVTTQKGFLKTMTIVVH